MIAVNISENFKSKCNNIIIAAIECNVINSNTIDELSAEIEHVSEKIRTEIKLEQINTISAIAATRNAYKKFGKDPNRYRPSAESLHRRIVRNIPIYRINTLVDIINLVSIKTAFSIGGFDANKIEGEKLVLDVGSASDTFEAIGRGILNIEHLPVYRDAIGGIGTPTSDTERTKITINTTRLLTIINAYSNNKNDVDYAINFMIEKLLKYASATNISIYINDEQLANNCH